MPFWKDTISSRNTGIFGYRLVELVYLSDLDAILQLSTRERRQGALAVTLIYGVLIVMAFPMTQASFYEEYHWFMNSMMVSVIATTIIAINSIILFPKMYWLHLVTSAITIVISFVFGMFLGLQIEVLASEEARLFMPNGIFFFGAYLVSLFMVQFGLRYMNRLTQNIARENSRKDDELRLGKELQSKLLAPVDIQNDKWKIFASGTLASEVGGDFFDVWEYGNSVRLFLGDVSGHGVGAGLMVSSLKAIIDFGNRRHEKVEDILSEMNSFIRKNGHKGMFATCVAMEIEAEASTMKVWNAGHPAISVFSKNGESTSVRPPGFALGMIKEYSAKENTYQVEVGSRIVAFTDGFVESMNKERQEFGKERLLAITKDRSKSGAEVFEELESKVKDYTLGEQVQDDSTLVVVDLAG